MHWPRAKYSMTSVCTLTKILTINDDALFQELAVPTIKVATLVFGIMEICVDSQVDKNRTHHLKLETVWVAAYRSVGRSIRRGSN
jgi:hypothetical protein